MKHIIKILSILFLTFYSTTIKADSWIDPDWKEMIDSSDVIVLVQFTTKGDFKAKAKPIKVYKGQLKHNEIWISNFSNRYGPIDTKKKGDKFLVFLNWNKPNEKRTEYLKEQVEENSDLREYFEDYKSGKAYYVWTPTSGDLKVKGNKVQYDLLQPTYYRKQKYSSLKEFESFLYSTQKSDRYFQEQLLDKLKKNPDDSKTAQYLMMLYLAKYVEYHTIFKDIAGIGKIESCYALAKLLGQIQNETSRDILVDLLDHESSVIQGEVVRQLSSENADFIGPILLGKLKNAGEGRIYFQNIMNPVMNSIDGGKIEIIKTLGELGYKPAIPELLPLLETDDEYVFETVMQVLIKLETKDYVPYLNKYLESCKRDFILDICYIIRKNNLTECIPSLMYFVANHDRTIHPSKEITISEWTGLAHFPTDTVKSFLYQDFQNVLKMESTGNVIDNKMDWIEEYMDVFVKLKIDKAKPLLYDFMFDYYGINSSFKTDSSFFQEKIAKEDSIKLSLTEKLSEFDIKEIKCIAFIEKEDYSIKLLDYTVNISFNSSFDFSEMLELLKEKEIDYKKISLTYGNSTHTTGARDIRRFGDNLMRKFLGYLASYPDNSDIAFMKNLEEYNFTKTDYDKKQLDKYILKAKENLINE